jgi:hypothetical protein
MHEGLRDPYGDLLVFKIFQRHQSQLRVAVNNTPEGTGHAALRGKQCERRFNQDVVFAVELACRSQFDCELADHESTTLLINIGLNRDRRRRLHFGQIDGELHETDF